MAISQSELNSLLGNMKKKGTKGTIKHKPLSATTEKKVVKCPIIDDQPFDAIKRAGEVEKIVMEGNKRLFYKFRYQRFYGGIATADAIGCNLLCKYCWNYQRNHDLTFDPSARLFSPKEISSKLESIAGNKTNMARISGCEPFLGHASARHLADIIKMTDLDFVIETNGVMLGAMPELLNHLEGARNFTIRMSLKAKNGLQFEKVTGANSWGYYYQLKAIEEIRKKYIPYKIAYMPQFINYQEIELPGYLEEENMRYYEGTKARLIKAGLKK
jgi:uncharacterized Fe-S cluster-containing radical SAM superfamily protein